MAFSDDYIRQTGRRAKAGKIKATEVRRLFFSYLENVPGELAWDVFNLFFPDIEDNAEMNEDDAAGLSAVIDLFEGEYEETELPFSDDQLKYISEGVNDFALELTDDVIMNVMKAAVARGLMG